MDKSKIIIAIDGHSSTGKSSFAKEVAEKLGYIYVDTGAIYRAVTYFAYTNGFISNKCKIDREGLKKVLKFNTIGFDISSSGKSETYLNGVNIEQQIRTLEISNKVSHISAVPIVRSYVDSILRKIGRGKGVVMDGRDIGSAVFPNAELKLFMTAQAKVRAERRYKQIIDAGDSANFDDVLDNIEERDHLDATRKTSPLVRAEDAILLDNSCMTIPEQFVWLNNILLERFGIEMK